MKVSHTVSFGTLLVLVVLLTGLGAAASAACVGDGRGLIEVQAPPGSTFAAGGPWGWFLPGFPNQGSVYQDPPPDRLHAYAVGSSGNKCVIIDGCWGPPFKVVVFLPDGTRKDSPIFGLNTGIDPAHNACYYLFDAGSGSPPTPGGLEIVRSGIYQPNPKMNEKYTIYTKIRNPSDQPVSLTVNCHENEVYGDPVPYPLPVPYSYWQDQLILNSKDQGYTLEIPRNNEVEFKFNYGHYWGWTGSDYRDIFSYLGHLASVPSVPGYIPPEVQKLIPEGASGEFIGALTTLISVGLPVKPVMTYSYTFDSDPQINTFQPVVVDVAVTEHKMDSFSRYQTFSMLSYSTTGLAGSIIWAGGVAPPVLAASGIFAAVEVGSIVAADGSMRDAVDPDANYQEIVPREDITLPELLELGETPSKEAALDMFAVAADTQALATTFTKYDGAVMAGDQEWQAIHLQKAAEYAERTALDISHLEGSMQILIDETKSLNLPITNEAVNGGILGISENGLPDIEVAMLKRLGYTDMMIADITAEMTDGVSANRDNILNYDTFLISTVHSLGTSFQTQSETLRNQLGEETIDANVLIEPHNLDISTTDPWISSLIEIPGHDMGSVDISTIKLNGIPAIQDTQEGLGDRDGDGEQDLLLRFPMDEVKPILQDGENDFMVTGKISESVFIGHDTVSVTGVVKPPVAAFTADVTSGTGPLTVEFVDRSSDATSWHWTFGDGGVSEEQNPSHTYTAGGVYTVALTIRNSVGSDTRTRDDYIHVDIPAKVRIVPRTINLASKGIILAFVRLPDNYNVRDVVKESVTCNGAPVERILSHDKFSHIFGAVFRKDQLQNVDVVGEIQLSVSGQISSDGSLITFSGEDTVRVIDKKLKGKKGSDDELSPDIDRGVFERYLSHDEP